MKHIIFTFSYFFSSLLITLSAQVNVQDSLTLVDVYKQTNGSAWNTPWNLNDNVNLWNGVTILNNRVTALNISNQNAIGTLPNLSTLTSLLNLQCYNNQLSGTIDLSGLSNLTSLGCNNNQLDSIAGLADLRALITLECSNNQLDTLPGILSLNNLDNLYCIENRLTFYALEQLDAKMLNIFSFTPQYMDSIPVLGDGRTYIDSTLTLRVEKMGINCEYQWLKNGIPITLSSTDPALVIPNISTENKGVYSCFITNPSLPATGTTQYSTNLSVGIFGIDSLGGVYYPNQFVVEYAPNTSDTERQNRRNEFQATVLDSCMCGQQIELWEIPDTLSLTVDGDIQYVHDDNEKKRSARTRSEIDEVDFNYIIREDGFSRAFSKKKNNAQIYKSKTSQQHSQNTKVKVAILDTGLDVFDSNSPLYPYRWENPDQDASGNDTDSNCYALDRFGVDIGNRNAQPVDENSHGSHLGRIITDSIPTNFVQLIPIKTHDVDGWGSLFNNACGIYYAQEKGADIINASWSYKGLPSNILRNAIQRVQIDDILLIAAVGNDSINIDSTLYYPASYDLENIIAVMTIDDDDKIPTFSNYSSTIADLAARGVDIQNEYGHKSGTSMSTAFVSRFAMLIKNRNGEMTYQALRDSIYRLLEYPLNLVDKCTTEGKLPSQAYQALPLELLTFEAGVTSRLVNLQWATAAEIDINGFEIQKSTDGIHFERVGYLTAKNQVLNHYHWIDESPSFSNYYRLKIEEASGEDWHSNIINISRPDRRDLIHIITNPVSNTLTFKLDTDIKNGILQLYSINGLEVHRENFSGEQGSQEYIDISALPKGAYYGHLYYNGINQPFKFYKL